MICFSVRRSRVSQMEGPQLARVVRNESDEEEVTSLHSDHLVAAYVILALLVLWFGLTYLAIFVSESRRFRNIAKWPRVAVVISLIVNIWLEVSLQLETHERIPSLWRHFGFCQFLMVVHFVFDACIYVGLVLASFERLISLWIGDPDKPGFNVPATIGCLCAGFVVSAIWSVCILFAGSHGPFLHQQGNIDICVVVFDRFILVFSITRIIEWVILLLLAMFLTGRLCHSQIHGSKPYPRNQIVPTAVADMIMVIAIIINQQMKFYVMAMSLAKLLVILVFLIGESDLRLAYKKMCCSCLEDDDPFGEKVRLMHHHHTTVLIPDRREPAADTVQPDRPRR